jgi:[protein-PII] uridylyltransferase
MSDTAQRRDISDPLTIRKFVGEVQSPELLRMLLVLTVADIRAVGPGAWNGWKGQLLRELYHESDSVMSGASAPARGERVAEAKNGLIERLRDWSEAAREDATSHFGENYWLSFDTRELERNARLRARMADRKESFALAFDTSEFRSISEIAICTPDQPGLFFKLAGAIAASGGSIVEAKAFTAEDGLALDVFAVQDFEGRPFGDDAQIARLHKAIARALSGQLPRRAAIIRRPEAMRAAAFEVRSRVSFDNEASASATVIELQGADRQGLLFDIARGLFELQLSISSAIVATYGERAVDVFYVRDFSGNKLTGPDHLARVEARLMGALTPAS